MAWETFPCSYTSPQNHSWIFETLWVVIFWVRVTHKILNVNWEKIHSIILSLTCHGFRNFPHSYTSPHIHSWIFKTLQVIIFWVRVTHKMLNVNWEKIHSITLSVTCHGFRNFPPLIHIPSYPFMNFQNPASYYCLLRGRHSEAAHEKRLLCAQKCTRGGVGGHEGVGWGGSWRGGVGWGGSWRGGVGWVMKGWGGGGVGWVGHEGVGWGGVGHEGVGWGGSWRGWGGSCRGGVGWVKTQTQKIITHRVSKIHKWI